jgi:hypothetical protein
MITQAEAENIAATALGRPADDSGRPWHLQEFDQGWLIREESAAAGSFRGGGRRVIERETGSVLFFPSSVPPGRILREYANVRQWGVVRES